MRSINEHLVFFIFVTSSATIHLVNGDVREFFPSFDSVVPAPMADAVTFGAIIESNSNDASHEVVLRIPETDDIIDTMMLQPSGSIDDLWVASPATLDVYDFGDIEWRVITRRCVFTIFCSDHDSPWQRFSIVSDESLLSETPGRAMVSVRLIKNGEDDVLFRVRKDTRNGQTVLRGLEGQVGTFLEGGTYYLETDGANGSFQMFVGGAEGSVAGHVSSNPLEFFIHDLTADEDGGEGGNNSTSAGGESGDETGTEDGGVGGENRNAMMCTSDPSAFNICLELEGVNDDVLDAFVTAKSAWEEVIVQDTGFVVPTANLGLDATLRGPNFPPRVDDIYIYGKTEEIDGPGGILGIAGPTKAARDPTVQDSPFFAVAAQMKFDAADLNEFEDHHLQSLIQHEMGHALGIGTLWEVNNLFPCKKRFLFVLCVEREYVGVSANREFNILLGNPEGQQHVPIEDDGGAGTAGGHWEESCFSDELMTGFLTGASQPLSTVTIGGLEDLGYQVNYEVADRNFNNGFQNRSCRRGSRRNLRTRRLNAKGTAEKLGSAVMAQVKAYGLRAIAERRQSMRGIQMDPNVIDVASHFTEVIYKDEFNELHAIGVGNLELL